MNRNIKNYGLNFTKSIERWDEAIPIGNGNMGALIYGNGPIKYSIDALHLWDNRECEAIKNKEFNYKTLIECAKKGKEGWKRKREIFEINHDYPYPTKISAGRIEIDLGESTDKICSSLDILTAVANVEYKNFKLESFVAATRPVGLIKIAGDYSLNLHIPGYFSGDENGEWCMPSGLFYNSGEAHYVENGCLKYPRSSLQKDEGFAYYIQKTKTDYTFAVVIYTKKCNGYDEIYYTAVSTEHSEDFLTYGKNILLDAAKVGYDVILNEHKLWWKSYWNKSDISIFDKEMEKTYYFNWYLFASTSRKGGYPMPLQGVWTADSDALPPWGGDYHHDTNTQMSYWGYAKANRLEEGKVFPDYLWSLRDAFKRHAKKVYNVDGYMIPGCSTRDGAFMGGSVQYALSPTMTIWAAKAFDDYYRYTGDISYLKNRAYPFMKRVGDAISGLLEVRNGKYYLPISSSPEIFEDEVAYESYNIGNTTFDQSLIIYLYKTLAEWARTLNEDASKYDEVLTKLDGIYISEGKAIMLSEKMLMPFSHRHFSHMMCIYPLQIFNYDTEENKKIIDNTLWDIERLGTGWWVGFSFPWCATLYAMAENGGAAYEKLRMFVKAFISPNGFHLNGDHKQLGFSQWHYRPFTLEALFAYNDAIQEMLMQDHMGYVDLFPAIPKEWKSGAEFKKFNTLGKISVSGKIKDGKISASFTAKKPTEISIKNRFAGNKIRITSKEGSTVLSIESMDVIKLNIPAGTTSIEEI